MSPFSLSLIIGVQLAAAVLVAVVLGRKLRQQRKRADELARQLTQVSKRMENRFDKLQEKLKAVAKSPSLAPVQPELPLRIVINTLPKVGSSSIGKSLQLAFPQALVDHTHAVSLAGQRALARDIDTMPAGAGRDTFVEYFSRNLVLRPELERLTEANISVFYICGIREPLAWALSLVTHLIDAGALPANSANSEAVRGIIMDWLSGKSPFQWVTTPTAWIEREIQEFLGMDPLGQPFDFQSGYQIMPTKRGPLLLLRQENFARLPQALAALLDAPASLFSISKENLGSGKSTASLYRELAASLKFPAGFVEQVYDEPYAATFYSPEERAGFVRRWSEVET